MGQKSSPIGLRLQINRTWDSRWFAEGQDYGRLLLEDLVGNEASNLKESRPIEQSRRRTLGVLDQALAS